MLNSTGSVRHILWKYTVISTLWPRTRFWTCRNDMVVRKHTHDGDYRKNMHRFWHHVSRPRRLIQTSYHWFSRRQKTVRKPGKIQKKTICKNLQTAASSWEQILHTSGGALELSKCAWYLINWEFTPSGIPFISNKTNTSTIEIQSSNDKKFVPYKI